MSDKRYALSPAQIRPLATGRGSCIASDRITVDGRPVGDMVREPVHGPDDSGWCFLAGDETQAYLDDPANLGLYDVNTIANYSPDIVPLLDAPPCSAFERDAATGQLLPVPYEEPPD